jgi:uncharacterized repeat protein (TIGR01451 family)
MKKLRIILLLQGLFLLGFTPVKGQVTSPGLIAAIREVCPNCIDPNGELLAEARTITSLSLKVYPNDINPTTTNGLQGFLNLKNLILKPCCSSLYNYFFINFLPPNLETLEVYGSGFETKDNTINLPSSLKELKLFGTQYGSLWIPKLPNSLKSLSLYNDVYISPNFVFTDSLKNLEINRTSAGYRNIKKLPTFPSTLETLNITYYKELDYNMILPRNLKSLTIFRSEQQKNFSQLPDSLQYLDISYCASMTTLPQLPKNLKKLFTYGTKISCLPVLPNGIDSLISASACIPNKPSSLRYYFLQDSSRAQPLICDKNNSNNCQYPANVNGKVYYDLNNDGIQNANEPNAQQILLKSTDNNLTTLTDSTGKYILVGDSLKTYTFSPIFSSNYFNIISPLSRTITTTAASAQRFDNLDFALRSSGTFPDIALSLTSGNARPGFNSISTLTYKNVGTTTLNGTITLTLDAKQTFVSADVIPTQNGNVLTWNYTNLLPFDFKNINITLKTLVTTPLSSLAVSTVNSTITGATDANPLNNSETTQITVRGSYDPNDKQVDKTAIKTVTSIATTPLTYTIRFQNTGNADAIRVEVVDSLPKKLDITSIEMLGASHPYELKIVSDSGKVKDFTVVKWTFDGIYLPDSTTNEKGSHGFVKFRIKNDTKKMGLTVDSIFNKAAIYFDFNPPIITNRVRTLFSPSVATTELKDLGLSVFPNPTSDILTINSTYKTVQNLTIDVINTNGQVLMHQILRGPNPQINVQELLSGLYFLKIQTAEGIGVVKIFKQ